MASFLRFLHAVPNAQGIDIYVNDKRVAHNLTYRNFTDYFKGEPGIYQLRIFPTGRTDSPLLIENLETSGYHDYTLAATGTLQDFDAVLMVDTKKYTNPQSAYIRYVNLSPFDTEYDILLNDETILFNLTYGEVSGFYELKPDTYYFKAVDSHSKQTKLSVPRMALGGGKRYACIIIGYEGGEPGLQVLVPMEGSTYLFGK